MVKHGCTYIETDKKMNREGFVWVWYECIHCEDGFWRQMHRITPVGE